ncbi:DUF998 domain-containing protein [Microbacterium chocolatum]|uniref:DUF998 domain-containing protein n=1 Tax=Microbacterium aurantiacum TaxID=162393 RepID=UPI00338F83DE
MKARVESEAIYAALLSGALGGLAGLLLGLFGSGLPLAGDGSLGRIAGIAAGTAGLVAAGVGYWRARRLPGQEWRLALSSWRFTVNTVSVALVHGILAAVAVIAVFLVLSLGFVGLEVDAFWAMVLLGVAVGLTVYMVYLSVSRMSTQRMSSLLMSFVAIGTLTAMVTSPDPRWWEIHFSQLGTFGDFSSLLFNGTLIVGGLLVTSFAVYLAADIRALADSGELRSPRGERLVPTFFVIMGLMLAGVGLVPVDVSLLIHNLCASGMAVMFLALLVGGPWLLRGMPRTYFVASWTFLGAMVVSTVLFAVGFFGLTAFEIVVFALIFGWIAVFIRFLGSARH